MDDLALTGTATSVLLDLLKMVPKIFLVEMQQSLVLKSVKVLFFRTVELPQPLGFELIFLGTPKTLI